MSIGHFELDVMFETFVSLEEGSEPLLAQNQPILFRFVDVS